MTFTEALRLAAIDRPELEWETARTIIHTEAIRGRGGRIFFPRSEAERRIVRLYRWKTWRLGRIDWGQMVEWMREHWDDVLRILFTILPFILDGAPNANANRPSPKQ